MGEHLLIGEIDRRGDHTYNDIAHLDRIAVTQLGDGLQLVEAVGDDGNSEKRDGAPRKKRGKTASRAGIAVRDNPLSSFRDDELASLGLPQQLMQIVRGLAATVDIGSELASRGLGAEGIEVIVFTWSYPERIRGILDMGRVPAQDDLALSDGELTTRLLNRDSLAAVAELDDTTLAAALAGSLEDWMLFVHPSQIAIAEMEPTGPISIRGGPGTGKTAVLLHRACHLITRRDYRNVLVTTYIGSLPRIWNGLFDVLLPDAVERRKITTRTVDSLAMEIVRGADGVKNMIGKSARTGLLEAALREVPQARVALGDARGLEEEIDVVIAGRGLDADSYSEVPRTGRKRPLAAAQRAHVWGAYIAYRRALAATGMTDWPHLRLAALDLAQSGVGPRFDALIVDEAQDLSETQFRFLLELDADPDHKGVMLAGDGGQAILPGGSRLSAVGLDVRGRSVVLRNVWRNTQFVILAAQAVLGDAAATGDEEQRAVDGVDAMPEVQRLGDPATLYVGATYESCDEMLALLIQDLVEKYRPGEVAVLAPTGRDVAHAAQVLEGYPTAMLADVKGLPPHDRVCIGTFHRAKGLEFKAVVITAAEKNFAKAAALMHADGVDNAEERDMLVRSLYVAMTRARDELSLIAHAPLPDRLQEMADAQDVFDVQEI